MKLGWYSSGVLGLIAIVTAVLRERGDVSTLTTSILAASAIASVAILLVLNVIYWKAADGQRFGGTNRHRIHVLTAGEIGVLLLLFQVWFIGGALILLGAVIYTHNIWKATEHVRLFGPPPKPVKEKKQQVSDPMPAEPTVA